MSDSEQRVRLIVSPDLPVDELLDAIEFVYLILTIDSKTFARPSFHQTKHRHLIQCVKFVDSKYRYIELDDRQLVSRAHILVDKLKKYCKISITDTEDGFDLVVLKPEK